MRAAAGKAIARVTAIRGQGVTAAGATAATDTGGAASSMDVDEDVTAAPSAAATDASAPDGEEAEAEDRWATKTRIGM